MLNSVRLTNSNNNKNVFEDISVKTSSNHYWILDLPTEQDIYVNNKQSKNKHSLGKTIGESIAAVAIISVGTAIFLAKGGPRGMAKLSKKLVNYLDRKIEKSKLENKTINVSYEVLRRVISTVGEKFEAINNFNTIKDYTLQKLLYSQDGKAKNIFARGHQRITKMFGRIAQKAVLDKYKTARKAFHRIDVYPKGNLTEIVEIDGIPRTKGDWIENIRTKNQELNSIIGTSFSNYTLMKRCSDFKNNAQNAIKEFFGHNGYLWFLSKKTVNGFVAESVVAKQRLAHKKNVINMSNCVSRSLQNLSDEAGESILKISSGLNYKDHAGISKLIHINTDFKDLAQCDNPAEIARLREKLIKQIKDFQQNLPMPQKIDAQIIEETNKMLTSLTDFKEGKVEEILHIYKKILPQNEYTAVEETYQKAVNKLNNAVKTETEDYTGKVRDLLLGSAPTDIISIAGGLATLGYFLVKSEDNDQRISVTLKHGIPALTGIATSLYGNAKLFAGSKSLFLGAASWYVTGKITNYLNDKFIKHVENKKSKIPE